MITPAIRGGHEVCRPVAVEGAEVGDAIAIRIKDIAVTSVATSSGNDQPMDGRFNGDPYCAAVCPGCGTEWPETRLEGIGPEAVRCASCGADCTPFTFTNGYTIAFDERPPRRRDAPRASARRSSPATPRAPPRCPTTRRQNPILAFAPHDIVALATRLRPVPRPVRHVAVDDDPRLAQRGRLRLVPRRRAAPLRARRPGAAAPQDRRAHGHRRGARRARSSICPVKVAGGGVYLGDMHALQGDGEIAGHTADVAGTVTLQVEVVKGLGIDGPVLFPRGRGPAVPRPAALRRGARARARARPPARHGRDSRSRCPSRSSAPAPTSTRRPTTACARAAELLGMTVPEVDEPRDDLGRDRDRPPPRRGAGDVPRAAGPAASARGLLGYAIEQYGDGAAGRAST